MTQPNGDHLLAWIEDETLSLRCRSYPYSISERGQMLAWFGTVVFRLSDEDSGEGYLPVFKKRAVGGPWRGEIERYLGLQPRFGSEGNSFGLTEDDPQATEGQPSGSKGPVYTADGLLDSDMLSLSDRSDRIDPFNWSSQEESIVLSDVLHCLLAEWKWSRTDTREAEKLSEGIKQFQPTSVQDGQESSAPQTQTQSSSTAKSSTVPSSGHNGLFGSLTMRIRMMKTTRIRSVVQGRRRGDWHQVASSLLARSRKSILGRIVTAFRTSCHGSRM